MKLMDKVFGEKCRVCEKRWGRRIRLVHHTVILHPGCPMKVIEEPEKYDTNMVERAIKTAKLVQVDKVDVEHYRVKDARIRTDLLDDCKELRKTLNPDWVGHHKEGTHGGN